MYAQDYVEIGIRRAIDLAIWTFDAWMLADETPSSIGAKTTGPPRGSAISRDG